MKSKRVDLCESLFGIKLPELFPYKSNRKIESEEKNENGILVPGKWEYKNESVIIHPDLEKFLPVETMTPEQALRQLNICSSIAMGWANDSYKYFGQKLMMHFYCQAILNCIYFASKNFSVWEKVVCNDMDFWGFLGKEIFVFCDGFKGERPDLFYYSKKITFSLLRLKLENGVLLYKGRENSKNVWVGNELYSAMTIGLFYNDNPFSKDAILKILNEKCNEVTKKLNATK
ncbi:MAG: hypothetical protein WCO35_01000 [Candidatus Nomurabacteria bacterium]